MLLELSIDNVHVYDDEFERTFLRETQVIIIIIIIIIVNIINVIIVILSHGVPAVPVSEYMPPIFDQSGD